MYLEGILISGPIASTKREAFEKKMLPMFYFG